VCLRARGASTSDKMSKVGRETVLTFSNSFQQELARESWTMYSLAILFIVLRTYVTKLQLNDSSEDLEVYYTWPG